jgi:hypothetical protein
MTLKPFKENRYQHFLRTVIWPWREKRPTLSIIAVAMVYVAQLLVYTTGKMPLAYTLLVVPAFCHYSWGYAYTCNKRYEHHQRNEVLDEVTRRASAAMARFPGSRADLARGYDIIQGEVVKDD